MPECEDGRKESTAFHTEHPIETYDHSISDALSAKDTIIALGFADVISGMIEASTMYRLFVP